MMIFMSISIKIRHMATGNSSSYVLRRNRVLGNSCVRIFHIIVDGMIHNKLISWKHRSSFVYNFLWLSAADWRHVHIFCSSAKYVNIWCDCKVKIEFSKLSIIHSFTKRMSKWSRWYIQCNDNSMRFLVFMFNVHLNAATQL